LRIPALGFSGSEEVGLNSRQLQRRLREKADLSAGAYIRAVRLLRAAELLSTGEVQTVKGAAEATGYRDPSHFSRLFREAHGHSPSELKS
jgi:transcriptional regulator GlxA family with amidase domain